MPDRFSVRKALRMLAVAAGMAPLAALAEVQVVTSGPVELRFTFPGARGAETEYYFGPDLLVAPGPEPASLLITGGPARVILRWRFNGPAAVSVNDRKLDTVKAADGSVSVQFDHQATSRLRW